jgi:DNA polymerase-1
MSEEKIYVLGDAVDGYSGCPGIGPKKAETVLANAKDGVSPWGVIVGAYVKAGLDEEDALLQARLARILQFGDYDLKTNKVKLWEPPTIA